MATENDAMFKEGFLKDVLEEIPARPVATRFPPEPNGFPHIGHAKAIAVNFGVARYHKGKCNLRYDDTNPEAEEEIYFTTILDTIRWLGYDPAEITYSSDNFDKLYDLAEKLIRSGDAYVCKCTDEELKRYRGGEKSLKRIPCPHRDRPIEKSLAEFRGMKDGEYKPKEAVLRMKMDLESGNPQMWDLIAYRVLNKPHHRTGDKWRIYPTYDFTHCICDYLEGITHSLCTVEFEMSRVSYDWLLDKLELPNRKPQQREYGRLSIEGTVLSKRKILALVNEGKVRGWDDPRLFTLPALRRRGIPPGAIRAFVAELGVTKAVTSISAHRFDNSIRKYLEMTAPRLMLVLEPVLVIIDNLEEDYVDEIELPFAPKDPAIGGHKVPFTKKIYIERSDFRTEAHPDYKRLTPGKLVGLLNGTNKPFLIREKSHKTDEKGNVTEIHAELLDASESVPKKQKPANIHWVGESASHNSPIRVAEVREFSSLFKSESPTASEGDAMKDKGSDSEKIYKGALIETGLMELIQRALSTAEGSEHVKGIEGLNLNNGEKDKAHKTVPGPEIVRFQGMRMAYFCLDKECTLKDSKIENLVLNQIVSLKEDAAKGA